LRLPIASDGWRFIIPLWTGAVVLLWLGGGWAVAGVLVAGLALFCTSFFRDFDQDTPTDESLIISPADGKVVDVSVLESGERAGWHIIRIFLSVFDVHVQRSPVRAHVKEVVYKPGLFLDARHERAHLDNEQSAMTLSSPQGTLVVIQIAGLIARRIVSWVKPGIELNAGQRYGLIRFGSQVDVIMPPQTKIKISVGERVVGGKTVIAKWS
jgi:phosphatidylserine decarboxylase